MIAVIRLGAAVAALAVVPSAALARIVPGDAFVCHEARPARAARNQPALPTFHARVGVAVVDRYTKPLASERYTLDLRKPEAYCQPVRIDAEEIVDPLQGLELYEARRTRRKPPPPPLPTTIETIESSLGVVRVRVAGVDGLAMPTTATGSVGGSGPLRDHFACYQVRSERGEGGERRGVERVAVQTAAGARTLEVRKPTRLCVPASVRGEDPSAPKHPLDLLCYDARPTRDDADAWSEGALLATRNAFGNEVLRMGAAGELCIPAVRADLALPTVTPLPTFTPPPTPVPTVTPVRTPVPPRIRIEPPAATGIVRDRLCFAAFMDLPDGSTVDLTATALWRVVDGTIAVPAGVVDDTRCFLGVAIGTTGITARDLASGLTSAPATLKAEWPIFFLEVNPKNIGLRVGDAETLTVVAGFTEGRTRNVTQSVQYESAAPSIARLPNETGNRSRIEGVGDGETIITVTDPFSSLSGLVRVSVGTLQSIVVSEGRLLFPGEAASLKTVGNFSGGFHSNLTQVVSYESSDPSVAVATNTPGDRSRVEAIAPGTAVITAIDAQSGIRSTCCGTVTVLGDALDLVLTPSRIEHRLGVDPLPLAVTAAGYFFVPPNGSSVRSLGARALWSSNDESVVAIGGVDVNDRRRLEPIAGGQAQIVATDPPSGLTSLPTTVTIFEHLDRLEVGTSQSDPAENEPRSVRIGAGAPFFVHGYFDGGRHRLMREVYLVASDPSLVFVDGVTVTGLHPGIVTISAVDGPSGLSSDEGGRNATLQIIGTLQRVALAPRTVLLESGQTRALTATGYHDGGATENVTQRVIYSSSDPAVVSVANAPGNRSRLVAVGGGTATISATDPETGISSTDSGEDTVVTVIADPLVRLSIAPPSLHVAVGATRRLVAAGTFSSGATRNYTQRVEWTSSAPAVVAAPNSSGDRSRIEAVGPGTAVVSIQDAATGLTSTDTGDDATIVVSAVIAIETTPPILTMVAGTHFFLTTVGTLDDGSTVNFTQDVVYQSSDESVVHATNQSGNRSRIEAARPGTATVTAFRASTYPQARDGNPVTVTVVAPE